MRELTHKGRGWVGPTLDLRQSDSRDLLQAAIDRADAEREPDTEGSTRYRWRTVRRYNGRSARRS